MEKICSWSWRPRGASKQECAFFFSHDNGWIYLSRDGGGCKPVYRAKWLKEALSTKPRDSLMENMKNTLDFLNVRLGGA